MKNRNKVAAIVLGTALMGSTAAFAGMNGSCGAGKCGGDMKKSDSKEMKKGSCGANMKKGSCGANMKKMPKKEGMMSGNAGKATGSCGAGKCGSM